ncbi:hypothetical protein O4158_15850 [Gordonia amicalis]|uniref:YrhK domain-containing protein n=2 Tax=Gordoniaceae TaxID=85026 RepID=A0AAE4R0V6_9ACTN|nr:MULTISPECIES: hypothetical protein [Gordonia]ATD73227.1 hypothetical protein CNO18_18770 [Gordonia sp. 1D]MBA5848906.1 hypothetical protein [Gordonia amicalis]MCZ4580543.1 hypothetical protein [Gordonia amicalis]MDV6311315.1 hypothetical protein [Gordonia amicalis]MDV7101389.1 hypothetical protein [Gordonia amicalis]
MVGSALFALGSAPGFGQLAGADVVNLCYFVGAWFFTGAGFIQLVRSGPPAELETSLPGSAIRAEWLSAATQSVGTILFNISTTSALFAQTVAGERHLVWSPDAGGSIAFLISGAVAFVAYSRSSGSGLDLRDRDWWSVLVNWVGCVAFGVSAVGAFVTEDGVTADAVAATAGTFVGALCFFVASAVVLPGARHR